MLTTAQIPLVQGVIGDPPSLYNRGDGGLSELVSITTIYRRVKVVRSADDVWQHDPSTTSLLLSGLDLFLREHEMQQLLRWVEKGGFLVVMDEYRTPQLLYEKINISAGPLVNAVTVGYCTVGAHKYPVLFNVYREVGGGRPVCWVDNAPVGAEVAYGRGRILVLGDSSVLINEVMRSKHRQAQLSFGLALLDRETIAFYEGGRRTIEAWFSPRVLVGVPYYLGRFLWYTILGDSPLGAVKLIAAGLLVLFLVSPGPTAMLAGLARYRRRKSPPPRADILFKESVKVWMDWVNKLGR